MRFYYLVFCLLICNSTGFSQQSAETDRADSLHAKLLQLEFSNTNFFRNNEYTNNFQKGYSLIGFHAAPKLNYQLSKGTQIHAGGFFLRYFGEKGFHAIKPIFTVRHRFSPSFAMLMGSLHNQKRHGLSNILYDPERMLTDPTEYGIQFLYEKKNLQADLWLDWQQFIHPGSPFQEEFVVGFSSRTDLLSNHPGIDLSLPVQSLIKHKGGQIDSTEQPISTLLDFAAGITGEFHFSGNEEHFIRAESYLTGFRKLTNESPEPFKSGLGLYAQVSLNYKSFELGTGYWKGNKFRSIMGDPLYQSFPFMEGTKGEKRELIEGNLRYLIEFSEVTFSARMRMLYDTNTQKLDYHYGIYLFIDFNRPILR